MGKRMPLAVKNYFAFFSGFLHDHLFALAAAFFIFVLGGILGFFSPVFLKQELVQTIFATNFGLGEPSTPLELSLMIFFHNLVAAAVFAIMLLGLLAILANGFVMGVFFDLVLRTTSTEGIFPFLLSILPHGMLEFPAFFFSAAIGIMVPVKMLFSKRVLPLKSRKEYLVGSAKCFIFVILPLLLAASFIETFITPAAVSPFLAYSPNFDSRLSEYLLDSVDLQEKQLGEFETRDITSIEFSGNLAGYMLPSQGMKMMGDFVPLLYNDDYLNCSKELIKAPKIWRRFASSTGDLNAMIALTKYETPEQAEEKFKQCVLPLEGFVLYPGAERKAVSYRGFLISVVVVGEGEKNKIAGILLEEQKRKIDEAGKR